MIARVAIMLAVALVGQVATTSVPPIERHRVGLVELGTAAQKVYDAFPAERRDLVDLGYEGMLSPALLLRFPGTKQRDGVVAELDGGRGLIVWRIEIRDPAFKTSKGIGVGSTVRELRGAYRLDSVVSGEGSVAIRVEELSASFVLDQSGPGGGQLSQLRLPSAVPDSTKVKSVLLTD